MPWTPRFANARMLGQLIENAIAIVERDQVEALAWAVGTETLTAWEEIHRARRTDLRFPFLAIGGRNSQLNPLNEGDALGQIHEIVFEFADNDPDPDVLADRMQGYYRAIAMMIQSAAVDDWTADTGATDAIWGEMTAAVNDITVAPKESGFAGYVMSAQIVATVQLIEE